MVKRTGCGIEKPSDLNGKRVALDTLQNSAGLWMRGILQDHYSVDLKTIEWWCQEEEDIPFEPARWMNVNRVPREKMLIRCCWTVNSKRRFIRNSTVIRKGDSRVALLFPEPKRAEIEYYKNGGFFPIMHTVIRQESYPGATAMGGDQPGTGIPAGERELLRAQ